jgi:hypothetical protein
MVTGVQRGVILAGLPAILFVQLCPLFEDPTALTKVRHPFSPAIVVFMLLSLAWLLHAHGQSAEQTAAAPTLPRIDLTCVRLC